MDAPRLIIGLALAIVTYMLILQWNEDYENPQSRAASTPAGEQAAAPALPPVDETPVAPVTSGRADGDIPVDTVRPEPKPEAESARPAPGRFVQVRTDALQATLDLRGGDLVQASLRGYPLHIDTPDEPFPLLSNSRDAPYIVQSGLVGPDGPDARAQGRPLYRSESATYTLSPGAEQVVVDLYWTDPDRGVEFRKRYTFPRDEYRVALEVSVRNQGEAAWRGNLYGQIKRGKQADPSTANAAMSMSTYLGAAFFTPEKPYYKVDFDDMDDAAEDRAGGMAFRESVTGGWVAFLQHYFVSAWVPNPDATHAYYARRGSGSQYLVGFTSPAQTVRPGEEGTFKATLYVGPKIQQTLAELSPGLELTVDYGWLWFLAQPLFWLLSFLHGFAGNWGVAIILITILIKLAFFQLSAASYRSMANMRRIQPELQRLKELHGDDRQRMSQEMMELYKREKINPLGGCLPILVQIPVFIALYWVLLESVELRHAPFYGWIQDLSVKDPYFVLPIAMGLTMFLQQQLNPTPPDPTQAMVLKILPILFTFFFLWFPSGLVLYWLVNNVLSIAQQWVITRKIEQAAKPRHA